MENKYESLIKAIIGGIARIIGPVALRQANAVEGLSVNGTIIIHGSPDRVVERLIERYRTLIGDVAVTIANRSAAPLLKQHRFRRIPKYLRKDNEKKRY